LWYFVKAMLHKEKRQRCRRFVELPYREKRFFLEAFLLHLWVGLLLKIIPFRWIPQWFSNSLSSVSGPQPADLELIRTAIIRAGDVSPWKNKCLVSSLAARKMLKRRRISSQLSLGVARGPDGKVIAHAWLKAGESMIIENSAKFTEIYSF